LDHDDAVIHARHEDERQDREEARVPANEVTEIDERREREGDMHLRQRRERVVNAEIEAAARPVEVVMVREDALVRIEPARLLPVPYAVRREQEADGEPEYA